MENFTLIEIWKVIKGNLDKEPIKLDSSHHTNSAIQTRGKKRTKERNLIMNKIEIETSSKKLKLKNQ